MPRGSKEKYSTAQKHKAEHIEDSYREKGVSRDRAEQIAWATVNKQSGGGDKGGSGENTSSAKKSAARHDSAENAAHTRKAKERTGSLESQTKVVLMEKAREKHITGRSQMNKQELILALRKA